MSGDLLLQWHGNSVCGDSKWQCGVRGGVRLSGRSGGVSEPSLTLSRRLLLRTSDSRSHTLSPGNLQPSSRRQNFGLVLAHSRWKVFKERQHKSYRILCSRLLLSLRIQKKQDDSLRDRHV